MAIIAIIREIIEPIDASNYSPGSGSRVGAHSKLIWFNWKTELTNIKFVFGVIWVRLKWFSSF